MGKVRVACFAVSIDGYGAGPRQSLQAPLGVGGQKLHEWFYPTEAFQKMFGTGKGTTGIDNQWALRSFENVGAWILGRNMFSPGRGPWDEKWQGWWGDEPPYHVPTFVLTHHARAPLAMKGSTTFHFVTGGHLEALAQARKAAGDRDIRIGGGVATIRQYLKSQLIDELHLVIAPVVLGSGERLFDGIDVVSLGYQCVERAATENATHVMLRRG